MAKGKTVKLDFTGTDEGGGRPRYPEGDYRVKVVNVKHDTSEDKGTPYLGFEFEIVEGKHEGKTINDRCYLTEKSMWRLRNALEAMGKKVPSSAVNLNLSSLRGKELGVTITDEEYENRKYSTVSDFISADLLDDDNIEEEFEDEEDEDEEDEDEEEELEEVDLEEL